MTPIRTAAFAAIVLLLAVASARAQTVTTVSPFGQQGVQTLPGTLPF